MKVLRVTPKGERYYNMCATVNTEGDTNIIEVGGDPGVLRVLEHIMDLQDEMPMSGKDYLEGRHEWYVDLEDLESYRAEKEGLRKAKDMGLIKEVGIDEN